VSSRRLIVNADDFGRSDGINEGVAHAHEHGLVTSASLMVRWPAAAAAAAYARTRTALAVGLHLDLSEWRHEEGEWIRVYERAAEEPDAVEREARAQLELFRSLLGADPTHLDSHQHVHRYEPTRSVLSTLGAELGVPVRDVTPGIRYRGDFYGQTNRGDHLDGVLSDAHLGDIVRSLDRGVTELGCHPAARIDFDSAYAQERLAELTALCSSAVPAVLVDEDVELVSFATLALR
jgi:chitin disaccharide deacetylase